jgi:hypothetical protein
LLFADSNGTKVQATPGRSGVCPGCRSPVIAKCGTLKVWHWAHEAGGDCDPWSEPMGPWHLSWQGLVRPEAVEVPLGPHRADIVGNNDVVVELQHSSIDEMQVREREQFYGSMVWLFDATERFRMVESGDRVFFAVGRVKHIERCQKPVFLDFGDVVVQVEEFTDVFWHCSGVGLRRDRQWFASQHLSERLRGPGSYVPIWMATPGDRQFDPWEKDCPYSATEHPSRWHGSNGVQTLDRGTKFLPLEYTWQKQGRPATKHPVWEDVIQRFPEIANGWTEGAIRSMRQFLSAQAMILDGRLRLMPSRADELTPVGTRRAAEELLAEADKHISAGRLPILKNETRERILNASPLDSRRR